ncbi:MAG: hypothetical protein KKD28_05960, partial [Chloroflexi bacterium]|nr:hypothetical protein [Chloroflexota bacterium]
KINETLSLGLIVISLSIAATLSACADTPADRMETWSSPTPIVATDTPVPPTETRIPSTPMVAQSTPTLPPTLAPTLNTATLPPPQYVISATLDYGWRVLTIEQDIVYPNTSSEFIPTLMLVVQPNWYPDVFHLTDLAWGDGQPVQDYTLDGIRLQIPLAEALTPGKTLQLSLTYELTLPLLSALEGFGPNPFGYTSRQTNLTDWYPFVPPYIEGRGWLVHNPWFYGEHLVYPLADFEVEIRITDAPDGIVIAASALDEGDGDVHVYRMEGSRNFVWSASPEYRVFQEQVGEVSVLGYAFPYDVIPGEAAFTATVDALELYTQLFGPYPFESLSMVQADFDHGMEYQGLYFLSKAFYSTYEGSAASYLVTIAAHETSHQWWFGLVGSDQALEPWLDEALATYSERLFLENLYPEALDWWWNYRVSWYEPTGWVDTSIYDAGGYLPYRNAVYLNGALFLEDLRALVGDEAFFAFLQDYASRNPDGPVTGDDFFAILREHSDADWSGLVAEYFRGQ